MRLGWLELKTFVSVRVFVRLGPRLSVTELTVKDLLRNSKLERFARTERKTAHSFTN